MPELLYHATKRENPPSIAEAGLRAGSYWAADENLLDYYVETIEEEGDEAVVLVLDLQPLAEYLLSRGVALEPDSPGIEEPITGALGRSEHEIWRAWANSCETWEDSLRIISSVRCPSVVPPEYLRVQDALSDEQIQLTDYIRKAGTLDRPLGRE